MMRKKRAETTFVSYADAAIGGLLLAISIPFALAMFVSFNHMQRSEIGSSENAFFFVREKIGSTRIVWFTVTTGKFPPFKKEISPPNWATGSDVITHWDVFGVEDARGFPFRAFHGYVLSRRDSIETTSAILTRSQDSMDDAEWDNSFYPWAGDLSPRKLIPYKPIWLGLFANTLIYAVTIGMLIFLWKRGKAFVRSKYDLCVHCGYSRKGLRKPDICPECGQQ